MTAAVQLVRLLLGGWAPARLLTPTAVRVYLALVAVGAVALFVAVNHGQWFVRDDWAFVVTRDHQRRAGGTEWLTDPQNGHFMAVPVALFAGVDAVFGLGSYAPFLALPFLAHAASVALAGVLARRSGAGPWACAAVVGVLAVFGAGWENLVFAVQITFNLSLTAALAQVLLVDHRGPCGRREVAAALAGVVGVMSSGYGVVLPGAVMLLLAARRRWLPLVVAVVPAYLVFGLWTLTAGDSATDATSAGTVGDQAEFSARGLAAAAGGLMGAPGLGIGLGLGVLAVVVVLAHLPWSARSEAAAPTVRWTDRITLTPAIALAAVAVASTLAIGSQRAGLGPGTGSSSRYVYVLGFLLAPSLAVAASRLVRGVPASRWIVVGLFVVATGQNVDELDDRATRWVHDTDQQRATLEQLARSPELAQLDPAVQPLLPWSPDVRVGDIPELVARGALEP